MELVDFTKLSIEEVSKERDEQAEFEGINAVAVDETKEGNRTNDPMHQPNVDISNQTREANGTQQQSNTGSRSLEPDSNLASLSQSNDTACSQDADNSPEHVDGHGGDGSTRSALGGGPDRSANDGPSQDKPEPESCDTEKQDGAETEDEHPWFGCDGPCFEKISETKKFYRCSYCIADLCESCHILIKDGKNLDFAVCGRTHERFEMQPVEKYPARMMKVGNDFVTIQGWLDELADEWGIKSRGVKDLSDEDRQ